MASTTSRCSSPEIGVIVTNPTWTSDSQLGVYRSSMMRNLADSRSSSTHSLLPPSRSSGLTDNRRTLLLIYIHGFMGNDSSFRSFPAHVHNYLKEALVETHVIHTKIYPRYKTYKSIDVACENFSRWLAPHESDTTDVVLVGHSMGGLLAADVVLMPSHDYSPNASPFRHRILGIICLDAPLLGLHPGIVLSGIASLFRPAPAPPSREVKAEDHASFDSRPSGTLSPDPSIYEQVRPPSGAPSPTLAPGPDDSTYNPVFFNDAAFVDRGWLKNIAHFANKHKQENLVQAAANHIMSHLEFGGCLADYSGLRTRYTRIRMLEDVDELTQAKDKNLVRVRFVNYYTVSTGLPKKRKPSKSSDGEGSTNTNHLTTASSRPSSTGIVSPRISIEPPREDHTQHEEHEEHEEHPLQHIDPIPITDHDHLTHSSSLGTQLSALSLDGSPNPDSQIPPVPSPPTPPDVSSLPEDKESRKAAEKKYKSAKKAYEEAVKAREKLIKAQQKQQEKARKDAEKQEKEFRKAQKKSEEKIQKQEGKEDKKLQKENEREKKEEERKKLRKEEKEKKKKLGKFCMLPPEGENDKTWIQVYMQDMDEVTAHCGLFVADRPDYEKLIGDVGERIAGWVEEEETRRVLIGEIGRVD
ncbi:hypothetical protein QBC38DRAFT_452837 [Podospora fimiseda]|uniref:AB hydrolase-1 domain-containing protein n=1 Tax=Podospora fimiseda TaxID=252190 RepID=A0AAN7GYQ2_9PEZI|nr:hypothetical protein QBC38DRAFT_452837 [Podospora fimiseda]